VTLVHVASIVLAALQAAPSSASSQTPAAAPPTTVVPHDWLVIAPVDVRGRRPFNASATFAKHLLDASSAPPKEGDSLVGELGESKRQTWTKRAADANGNVGGEPVQMAFTAVEWPLDGVALAELHGAGVVWVNGVAQVGDVYGDGMGGLPVPMRKGTNLVYVTGTRGAFRLAITTPTSKLVVNPFDATKGDLVRASDPAGDAARRSATVPVDAAVVVMNASDDDLGELNATFGSLPTKARDARGEPVARAEGVRDRLGPRGIAKVVVHGSYPWDATIRPERVNSLPFPIAVTAATEKAATSLSIEVREPLALRRLTYVSEVDDSLQEYALLPPSDGAPHSIVLTLHGAGVDCWGQAASYSQKPDLWIAAPTNRRRFGFDWQDWGRRDAYDVLSAVQRGTGSTRREDAVFLTGHSMGGHGTWHVAANDVDTFAAIAPSAGWSSFDSYGGGRPSSELSELWQSADGGARTLSLVDNLKQLPTFVLHGTADDNVPLSEAQLMLDAVTKAGGAPLHHFQEGAGHWWDGDRAPGADCVDWPEIFELFRRSKPRERGDPVDFTTNDVSYANSCRWIRIVQPSEYGKPSHVAASFDATTKLATVTTSNVRAIAIWPPSSEVAEFAVTIDGDAIPASLTSADATARHDAGMSGEMGVVFVRSGGHWSSTRRCHLPLTEKSPDQSGPFKRAFDHSFVLVYGTSGTAQETRELYERARFDAALWWYRANGHALVLSDAQYLKEFGRDLSPSNDSLDSFGTPTDDVILYGNRDTNRLWSSLGMWTGPIDARRGELRLLDHTWIGDDLGAVFVRPHPRRRALVAAFADTGVKGARLGYTLLPFLSGVGYPDYALFSSAILTKGDGGVLAAGWFDHDWTLPKSPATNSK
jgi:predicted esterase